jgi:predicted CXXCH cytochrome family protein
MNRPHLPLLATVMTVLAIAGCSPETRYRTLSFFFDGVPNPDELAAPAAAGRSPGGRPPEAAAKSPYRSHGPYDAKLCEACHLRGGGKLVLPVDQLCLYCHELAVGKKHMHGPVASGGCRVCHLPHGSGHAFLLVSEPTAFCFHCHDKAAVGAGDVHRAAPGTQCTQCHDPHSSDSEYLLK